MKQAWRILHYFQGKAILYLSINYLLTFLSSTLDTSRFWFHTVHFIVFRCWASICFKRDAKNEQTHKSLAWPHQRLHGNPRPVADDPCLIVDPCITQSGVHNGTEHNHATKGTQVQ